MGDPPPRARRRDEQLVDLPLRPLLRRARRRRARPLPGLRPPPQRQAPPPPPRPPPPGVGGGLERGDDLDPTPTTQKEAPSWLNPSKTPCPRPARPPARPRP